MKVFFYGLFMDVDLLAKQGVAVERVTIGWVNDFAIRISQRATLVREAGGQAYGVLMDVDAGDLERLYAGTSVADYAPETLLVNTQNGNVIEATCYNLPAEKIVGENKEYAQKLLNLAKKLDFPASYTDQILRVSK